MTFDNFLCPTLNGWVVVVDLSSCLDLTFSDLFKRTGAVKKGQKQLKLIKLIQLIDKNGMTLVQYVIIRKDLQTVLNWPLGALIAQACHAVSAVLELTKEDEVTKAYLSNLDKMHKVVLGAPDLGVLEGLSSKLTERGITYKLWIEQPEDIPTCIALKPYEREEVKGLLRHLKLLS